MQYDAPALRLYRGLLSLYPAEFRDHFSREMCLALADRLRERPGPAAVLDMYFGVLADAPREHWHMIRQDIVYTLRTMRKQKLTAFAAIAVLALGIGSTATVFTLVNGLLLRPLPYPEQERLAYVEEFKADGQGLRGAVAYPNYLDFRARNRTLEDVAMFGSGLATLRGDMEAERVPAASATEPVFRVLGVAPMMGRTFTAEEDRPGAPDVVVLSEGLWRRRYGADPRILGKTIVVGSAPARVIGVMPRDFHFPDIAQLWMPLQLDVQHNKRTDHGLEAVARLRPGVSFEQAQDDLRAIMAQITAEHPTETYRQTVNAVPYRTRDTRQVRPLLYVLLGAVGFVLLIACANITNLLLVKAAARTREVAVRAAMGASRARLVRQFVVESLMLGIAGAACGVLLAWGAVPALLAMIPQKLPTWIAFSVDWRVLAVVTGVTLGTGLLVGLVPALSASRFNIVETLKEGGRSSTAGGAASWLRGALVVAEVAMSLLLLIGAGLMIQTFGNLTGVQTGYRTDDITTFQAAAPGNRYPTGEKGMQLVRAIRGELSSLPGVASVAVASGVPLLDGWGRSFTAEGAPMLSLKDAPLINHTVVSPGYFQTLGIPIVAGRDFTEPDGTGQLVAIIDAELAKRYWPNESAIGKRVRFGPPEDNEPWHTVIGVAGVVHNLSLRKLGRNSAYLPYGEFRFANMAYLVRTAPGQADVDNALRARVAKVDRSVAVSRLLSLHDAVSQSIWQERFFTTLFASFGVLALAMAVVGLYGVMAYSVSRRTHEMGIRMALGASAGKIRRMVLAQSGRLAAVGLLAGGVAAALLSRFLETQLYGVAPGDPKTFAAAAVLLAGAALLAGYLPARRATRVDPMIALREE
ncbi:MAG TPA: ABC transporter permease [Bryobacteraceae bacterium]|jgi:putative ABC transport system permease protein